MNRVSLILQGESVLQEAKMSKWSHFMLWPVVFTWSAIADEWALLARASKCSVFLWWSLRFVLPTCKIHPSNQSQQPVPATSFIGKYYWNDLKSLFLFVVFHLNLSLKRRFLCIILLSIKLTWLQLWCVCCVLVRVFVCLSLKKGNIQYFRGLN